MYPPFAREYFEGGDDIEMAVQVAAFLFLGARNKVLLLLMEDAPAVKYASTV